MVQDLLVDMIGRDAGRVIALQGDRRTVSSLLISLSMKLQKGAKVALIDACGTFNPVFLKESYHKSVDIDVKNLLVAKPLSAVELRNLTLKLESFLKKNKAKVLVINGIDELFYKEQMNRDDLNFQFASIFEEISRLTRDLDLVTLVGMTSSGDLAKFAAVKADFVAKV